MENAAIKIVENGRDGNDIQNKNKKTGKQKIVGIKKYTV